MGKRREGREAAVQYLFSCDMHSEAQESQLETFWTLHTAKAGTRQYAETLIKGVLQHQTAIDEHIRGCLVNFSFERLSTVDRNVLRMAVHELLHCPEVPAPVVLNEAIEVAKALSAGESGSFVNGVLDRLAKKLRPNEPRHSRPAPAPNQDSEPGEAHQIQNRE
ncbi:MAG: transcription antitermination factor NusB [Verrucomicrobiaceae bacterium]|jgi:N utilization substance protein B|nr:transcription antitermination factor NusB [Verrucomicrobiaceae bacterium]